jgi:hypothetical protein
MIDAVVELSGANPGGPVLQQPYRPDHALGQPIGEQRRQRRTGDQQRPGAPERCT